MGERILATGNEAVGLGALNADCDAFFGYPITPQSEIPEWISREFPKRGKIFLQSQSETGSMNMLYGGAIAGMRVMTSTSSPGWSLMLEAMSYCVFAELPCVVVLVQRGGPGLGMVRQAQMDYVSAVNGGGHGGYKTLVLTPYSVQETYDYVQLAFHLADKYRNPVVVLIDPVIAHTMESMEITKHEFEPLPEKDWALRGKARQKHGTRRVISSGGIFFDPHPQYGLVLEHLGEKYQIMEKNEPRYDTYRLDDAELVLVAYGYVARVCTAAIDMARDNGQKVGLLRLLTAWPFPQNAIENEVARGVKFLVVEDSLGQLVNDVKLAVEGRAQVHLLGSWGRHLKAEAGALLPKRVLEEIESLI